MSTPNLLYSTQVFKYSPVFTWGPGLGHPIDSGMGLSITIDKLRVFINKTLSTQSLINQLLIKRVDLSTVIDNGKIGQGMRSCKCTNHNLYAVGCQWQWQVCVSDAMVSVSDGKNFQLSTICQRGFGTKIMFFTYGFTTFIGKKFIDSCSLGLRQMAAILYRSAERNKAYKGIPSFLLPHPPRGRHTSNRLPLLPASSWPW